MKPLSGASARTARTTDPAWVRYTLTALALLAMTVLVVIPVLAFILIPNALMLRSLLVRRAAWRWLHRRALSHGTRRHAGDGGDSLSDGPEREHA